MSIHRFMKFPDGTMKKSFIVRETDNNIHRISVPIIDWNNTVRIACSRWIKSIKLGNNIPFRWGTYEIIPTIDVPDTNTFICNDCKKVFKSRKWFSDHIKICKSQSKDLVVQYQKPLENVVEKQIRQFGKENTKWVTSDLLYGALNNLHNAIPVMMRKKHFNDKFPENKNIRIDTKRDLDHRMQVFEEGRWLIKGSKQTFYKVLVSICDILSEALEEDEGLMDTVNEIIKEDDGDSSDEEEHIGREIRRLRNYDNFIKRINKIRPLWHQFREKIRNAEQRTDLWEDLKTLLLDRQLAIEQGFD